ncbi:hypothetical protein D3C73_1533090 [compost metagenome]
MVASDTPSRWAISVVVAAWKPASEKTWRAMCRMSRMRCSDLALAGGRRVGTTGVFSMRTAKGLWGGAYY